VAYASHRHEPDSTHIAYHAGRASRHLGAVVCVLGARVTKIAIAARDAAGCAELTSQLITVKFTMVGELD
jgi:hypothetical protein